MPLPSACRAALSEEQIERVRQRVVNMLLAGIIPYEFKSMRNCCEESGQIAGCFWSRESCGQPIRNALLHLPSGSSARRSLVTFLARPTLPCGFFADDFTAAKVHAIRIKSFNASGSMRDNRTSTDRIAGIVLGQVQCRSCQ